MPVITSDVNLLYDALLRGMGRITHFSAEHRDTIRLYNSEGHVREVSAFLGNLWCFGLLWPYISEEYQAHETIRRITVPLVLLDALEDAFYMHPPRMVSELRFLISREEILNLETHVSRYGDQVTQTRPLAFPRLNRVEIGATQSHGTRPLATCLVVHILQHITCSVRQTVEVGIDADIAAVEDIRQLRAREQGGRWHLLAES